MTTTDTPVTETPPLETLVRQWLAGRAHVRDLRVVHCEDGVVLEGHATCYYAKQLAQHMVVKVLGLPLRANRIEVR